MPTYAVLGATGQTGGELLKLLLSKSAHVNIYARSKSKLETKFPGIADAPNVTLFIGNLSDTALLSKCLDGVDVVLSAVAQNRNEPGCSVAQETAYAIIQALKPKQLAKIPTVVFLGSGSIDPDNIENKRPLGRLLHWILYHVYTDLEKAVELLKSNPSIPLVIAAPGALVHDVPHSVELVGQFDKSSGVLAYADLAQAMIMMGDEGKQWRGRYVGILVNQGRPIKGNPAALLRYLLPNLLAMVCPPLWRLGKDYWPA